MFTSTSPLLTTLVSGVFCGLCILFPQMWVGIWIAPILYIFYLLQAPLQTRAAALCYGWFFGFVLNFTVSSAGWSAYPLSWIGIPNPFLSIAIIGIICLGSSAIMGLASALVAALVTEARRHDLSTVAAISLPFLWIFGEWLQALLYSIFALGNTSTLNAFSQIATLGLAFGHSEHEMFTALVRFGGMPVLSTLVIAFGIAVSGYLASVKLNTRTASWLFFGLTIVGAYIGLSALSLTLLERARGATLAWNNTKKLTIAVAQTDFPAIFADSSRIYTDRNDIAYSIAKELAERNIAVDAIIYPETIGNYVDKEDYAALSALVPKGTLIVHSKYTDTVPRQAQIWEHEIGGHTFVTDKQYLMPYGEYMPYHFAITASIFAPNLFAKIKSHRAYAGGTQTHMGSSKDVPIGTRSCSEIFSPYLYRHMAQQGAGILAQSSSIKIFEGSPLLTWMMQSAARLRAVENGLPILQAMNGARGVAYDCTGKQILPSFRARNFDIYEITSSDACRR